MKARPILTLLLLATVFPELFTGSTSLLAFLNPGMFLWLLIGYGLAVLLARELVVRCGGGLLAMFLVGLAYGILNEGLLAKTVLLDQHLPVSQYDRYGFYFGISFPWLAGISVWHAAASMMFPILFTHFWYPQRATGAWLKGWLTLLLTGLLLALACLSFLGPGANGKGSPNQLIILLGLMSGLGLAGALTHGIILSEATRSKVKLLLIGVSVLAPFRALELVARVKAPIAVYFATLLGFVVCYHQILRRNHGLKFPGILFFAVGWYLQNALQAGLVIALMGNLGLSLGTLFVDALVLFLLWRGINRDRPLLLL